MSSSWKVEESLIINEIATQFPVGSSTYDDLYVILKGKLKDKADLFRKAPFGMGILKKRLKVVMEKFMNSPEHLIKQTAIYYKKKYPSSKN